MQKREVRKRAGAKENVGIKMKRGIPGWFEHVKRMQEESMRKQIYNGTVTGCRSQRRSRLTFHERMVMT